MALIGFFMIVDLVFRKGIGTDKKGRIGLNQLFIYEFIEIFLHEEVLTAFKL